MKKFAKAVFIGINYPHSRSPLLNCINDAKAMLQLIQKRNDLKEYVLLTDDETSSTPPTRLNILKAFDWLFKDVEPGSNLFIHYSGHGGSVRDKTGKESDGMNETLCPCDFEKSGEILDDVLNICLVKRAVELGVHLFVITDSCHSGSNCDERYSLKEVKEAVQPQMHVPQPPKPQYYPQPQMPQYYPQPQYPQYVIYNGKHYPYKVFHRKYVQPIDDAVEFLRQRHEHKLRELSMPEYHRSRSRDRDRGVIDWFKKKMDELRGLMKTNPYIAHLLKTGIPIYPKPEFVGFAASVASIAFPPVAPFVGAMSAAYGTAYNSLGGGGDSRALSAVSAVSTASVRERGRVKWSNTEDTKMPKYTGTGTFLKLSGCRDEQTSADGYNSRENGALSGCILDFFEGAASSDMRVPIGDFLYEIRSRLLKNRFEQIPQLGSNASISADDEFPI